MAYNTNTTEAHHLLYIEFPRYYTFGQNNHWRKRQREQRFKTIGRIYTVHPSEGELYYLRLLLFHIRGAKSFQDMRTFDGILYSSYKETAEAMGLLESDQEWDKCLEEAVETKMPHAIRELFATLLLFCQPTSPHNLWGKYKNDMIDDYVEMERRIRETEDLPETVIERLYNKALEEIQKTLESNNKSLKDFPEMPLVDTTLVATESRLILDELEDDPTSLVDQISEKENMLNYEQREIYNEIINSVYNNEQKQFFINAAGGTGKSFLFSLLLNKLRSDRHIALAVASSGIAAILLPKG